MKQDNPSTGKYEPCTIVALGLDYNFIFQIFNTAMIRVGFVLACIAFIFCDAAQELSPGAKQCFGDQGT